MYLKSIRVQGFKTFARRTELPFSRGVTAIVGPNGSGKSNLVDAIRWALGERNARGLRGHRMEDVIYAGGPGKAAVGMAEVTLLIDNADQRLNVEFSEIEVARRLYRSGESEYLINGTRARLKDIDALLASTGLRQDGYAVTAQNDIDYVIQAAPEVRRELIEEAAGVRRLRDQRQEAVARLEEAERDMRRARDVLAELSPRAEELREQASAAEEYRAVADQLRTLQGSLAKDAWRKAMVQLRRARAREQTARIRHDQATGALDEFQPRYAQHREDLTRAREARWRHQQVVADARLQLAESQHQVRIVEERAQSVAHALEAARLEVLRLSESERAGSQVVAELERSLAALTTELEAAQAAEADSAASEERAQQQHRELGEGKTALRERGQELHRDRLSAEAEIRQLEGRVQFLREQRERALDELQTWATDGLRLDADVAEAGRAAAESAASVEAARQSLAAVEQRVAVASEALARAERAVSDASAAQQAKTAELRALRLVHDRAQSPSALANRNELALRRLVELVRVDERDRVAVEAVLEGVLQGWVAVDGEAAERAIALLADDSVGKETILLDPGRERASRIPPGLQPVAPLIEVDAPLRRLISHLVHDLVLVESLAEARRVVAEYPDLQAVTRRGELLTPWSYRGGRAERAPLQAEAQIRDLESALGEMVRDHERARHAFENETATMHELARQRAGATSILEQAQRRQSEAAGRLVAAQALRDRDAEAGRRLDAQLAQLAELLMAGEIQLERAHGRHRAAVADAEAIERDLPRTEASLQRAAADAAAAVSRRQDLQLRAALARQRHDDLDRQLTRARAVCHDQGDALALRRAAALELESQPARLDDERRHWQAREQAVAADLDALDREPLPDADAVTRMEAQVREDEQQHVALQVDLAHAADGAATALAEVEVAQAEVDRCALALREDPQAVEDDEAVAEVDWQRREREVSRLQRRLDAMGAVNLLAPDEYRQVNDRCQSLASQLQDLEAAATQLVELRKRLEHEIDDRFRTVFQAVAVNFQEFFGELFPGGRATLRLEEAIDDPLDEGVEILAQTPGKRLQPLTLLSGGERALTALAFLFGLQAVNPSPFYVLDEVDAALDDANVVRFNRVLDRLAKGQQFLVVTHNHSTMAQAEVLYGVTLGEHGVSRIVSVRLQQDEAVPRLSERTA